MTKRTSRVLLAFAPAAIGLLALTSGCNDSSGPEPVEKPAAPANLSATATSQSCAGLTWSDQSANEDGFRIMRGLSADVVLEIATVDPGVTSYTDTGLDDVTTYFYRVYSFNAAGNSDSYGESSATTDAARPYGVIETYLGTGACYLSADGLPPLETSLCSPVDLTFGPDGRAYVIDWNSHVVRVCDGLTVESLIGVGGEIGDAKDGSADSIRLNHPTHITFDPAGNLILTAWHNSKVMRMDMATEQLVTIAGTGARCWRGDGGPATAAKLNLPVASAYDASGNLYILDMANQRVRVVDGTGTISTVLGASALPANALDPCSAFLGGFQGDEGPAIDARINMPVGQMGDPGGRMEIGANGCIYIADSQNHRVRMIDGSGTVHTIAGNGLAEYTGDGGPATQAGLFYPSDVAVDGTPTATSSSPTRGTTPSAWST
ncbi:MAG: hypothetical protein L0206_22055 [Actinobacteria bacterium]|nr:hypothetical protein [Actinomycetota bacterium]